MYTVLLAAPPQGTIPPLCNPYRCPPDLPTTATGQNQPKQRVNTRASLAWELARHELWAQTSCLWDGDRTGVSPLCCRLCPSWQHYGSAVLGVPRRRRPSKNQSGVSRGHQLWCLQPAHGAFVPRRRRSAPRGPVQGYPRGLPGRASSSAVAFGRVPSARKLPRTVGRVNSAGLTGMSPSPAYRSSVTVYSKFVIFPRSALSGVRT